MLEGFKSMRDLGRLHDVASVLVRYGFGDIVQRLGLGKLLERAGRALRWKDMEELVHMDSPERVRCVFEELGPTFIKLGQLMATRVDIFPPEWIAEFEKLHDRAPPVPFAQLKVQMEEDLGESVEVVFKNVSEDPVAAASIAQVHRASLESGEQVILKVRRPGIRRIMEADMRILAKLVEIAESRLTDLKRYQLPQIVRQFELSMRRELDLASEARHSQRIAASFKGDPNIVIPRVYWEWTSERLNVQEYIDGVRGSDLAAIDAAGLDRGILARRGAEAVLKMIIIDGFFHADPHLGNFFCLPENRLALIDFGMVGRLSDQRREQIADLLEGLVGKDSAAVIEIFSDWAEERPLDIEALTIEVDSFLDHYHGVPLKRLDFAAMMTDMVGLLRDHQLTLPPDLALLFKALITLDGVGRRLDPDFDIVAVTSPFLQRVTAERYAPGAVFARSWRQFRDFADLMSGVPGDLRRVIRAARRGTLHVNVDVTRLDHFGHQLDKAASRITMGLVTAAIIVGTAIVMTTVETESKVFGMPMLGFIGFVGACIAGIWIVFSVWRSGRE
jgi:ubiquinone biosynthesis protein